MTRINSKAKALEGLRNKPDESLPERCRGLKLISSFGVLSA